MAASFHDGFLDGVMLLDPKMVYLYLRTLGGERHTLVGRGLERLRVSNFLQGNFVFDIEVMEAGQITEFFIERLYKLSPVDLDGQTGKLLEMVKRRSLTMIVVSSSYGADLLSRCHFPAVVTCPSCKSMVPASTRHCNCGHEFVEERGAR